MMRLARFAVRLVPELTEFETVVLILGAVPLLIAAALIVLWSIGVSR